MMYRIMRLLALAAILALLPAAALAEIAAEAKPVIESKIEDDGMLRVRLSSLGKPQALNLTIAGAYAVESGAGFRFERGAQLQLCAYGGEVWLCAGGMAVNMGAEASFIRCAADGENGLYIAESEKDALYCGDLHVRADGNTLTATLTICIEDYLYGVVAYEMSDSFPIEALKAQAVAARTYAARAKTLSKGRDYDVVDTASDQVFKGFIADYENVVAAVDATCGVVGTYNGSFAGCYYTASNGGQIALPSDVWGGSGDYGYIERKDDPFDLENPRSLVNSIDFSADLHDAPALKEMLCDALDETLGDEDWIFIDVESIQPENPNAEGSRMYQTLRFSTRIRVWSREESGEDGAPDWVWLERTCDLSLDVYDQIKRGLNLGLNRRDVELVSVDASESGFTIALRRFGHGVGMSQRGAQRMAGQYGCTWREILGFYYPGMTLERVDWQTPPLPSLADLPSSLFALPDAALLPTEDESLGRVALTQGASTLNVRSAPSYESRVLGRLSDGCEVIVYGAADEQGWLPVRIAGIEGYVRAEYIQFLKT